MRTIIVALLVALSPGPVQSHQPQSPESRKTASEEEQPAIPPESFWQRATSDPVAVFTGALVVFTGVLAVVSYVQLKYLNSADETARTAANAARDSVKVAERQFLATVRPRIVVRQFGRFNRDGESVVEFLIANSGGASARVVESRIAAVVQVEGDPLPLRPFDNASNTVGQAKLASGEAVMHSWTDPKWNLEIADNFGNSCLHILGYIVYEDEAGVRRRTAYCRYYDRGTERFRRTDNPDYEYAD